MCRCWRLRAIASIGLRQFEEGLADANQAIRLDPNSATAYIARGAVYRVTGKLQEALADFDRSISLNPKDGAAFAGRGQTHLALRQFDKALVDFDQALVLNRKRRRRSRRREGFTLLTQRQQRRRYCRYQDLRLIATRTIRLPNSARGWRCCFPARPIGRWWRSTRWLGRVRIYDILARVLRARVLLAKKDTASAPGRPQHRARQRAE